MESRSKRAKTEFDNGKVSEYFSSSDGSLAEKLLSLETEMVAKLAQLTFGPPITHVYNPLIYASETHGKFVRKFLKGSARKIIFLGMNPGPFGMVQSGVPFGECTIVKSWMGIDGFVGRPTLEHPKRPVIGLDCKRKEVSGTRFWGLFQDICVDPEIFFENTYVHNYCPLAFVNATGKNVTPADFKKEEIYKQLENICDEFLMKILILLNVEIVVALGKFAYDQCRKMMKKFPDEFANLRVERILHPSPMNPAANVGGGWKVKALEQLKSLNLLHLITGKEEN